MKNPGNWIELKMIEVYEVDDHPSLPITQPLSLDMLGTGEPSRSSASVWSYGNNENIQLNLDNL